MSKNFDQWNSARLLFSDNRVDPLHNAPDCATRQCSQLGTYQTLIDGYDFSTEGHSFFRESRRSLFNAFDAVFMMLAASLSNVRGNGDDYRVLLCGVES